MKVINLFLIAVISVSCAKRDSGAAKAEYVGDRDSLIVNFLLTQFQPYHYNKNRIEGQLKSLRSGSPNSTYTRSLNATLRNFHFQSFVFDSQAHPPFAVEVSDDKNNLLSLFTFTDEIYYSINSLRAHPYPLDSLVLEDRTSKDSLLTHKINLEINLNAIIQKLKIREDKDAISGVIVVIFQKLLEMKEYEDSELAALVKQVGGDPKAVELIHSEYDQFMSTPTDGIFRFRSLEGGFGYWRIWIADVNGVNTVKAKFFSDVLFTAMFM